MNRQYAAVGVVGVLVVAGILGALAVGLGSVAPMVDTETGEENGSAGGDGEAGQSGEGDSSAGSDESGGDGDADSSAGSGSDGSDSGGGAEETDTKFDFTVQSIENCGQTCRDVTVRLTNTMDEDASNVDIQTRIYTDGDEIWSGSESFSEVASGESKTATKRVELGFIDAAKVQQNDGMIRIETVVTWDGGEQTFAETRKVA